MPGWAYPPDVHQPWMEDYLPWMEDYPPWFSDYPPPLPDDELEKEIRRNRHITIFFSVMITLLFIVCVIIGAMLIILPTLESSRDPGTTEYYGYGYGDYGDYGAFNDSAPSQLPDIVDGPQGWSEWATSGCSVSCGLGTITKRRTCSGASCDKPKETEQTECYQGVCTCSFYVSNYLKIFQMDESGALQKAYTTTGRKVSLDLAYDPWTKALFWSNKLGQIVRNGQVIRTLPYNLGGLIVDTMERLIFVAAIERGVFSFNFDGKKDTYLVKDTSMQCETLINLQMDKILFWINNKRTRVESIKYDGTDNKILHKFPHAYGPVTGMTVDIATKTLYWLHSEGAKIFSLPHDSSDDPKLIFSGSSHFLGEDLVICKGNLFYLDSGTGGCAVFKIGTNGKNRRKISKSVIKCDSLYLNN